MDSKAFNWATGQTTSTLLRSHPESKDARVNNLLHKNLLLLTREVYLPETLKQQKKCDPCREATLSTTQDGQNNAFGGAVDVGLST